MCLQKKKNRCSFQWSWGSEEFMWRVLIQPPAALEQWLSSKHGFGVFLRHCDLVLTNLCVFSAEVMGQTSVTAVLFPICETYSIECFSYVLYLHQKKSFHWAFLTSASVQHRKIRITTWNLVLIRMSFAEWSCSMQWSGKWINEPGTEEGFLSCPHFIFSVDNTLYSSIDLRVASRVFTRTFPIKEEGIISSCMSDLCATNCRIPANTKPLSQTPQSFQLLYTLAGNWSQLEQQ